MVAKHRVHEAGDHRGPRDRLRALYGLELPVWFRILRRFRHGLPLRPNRSLPRRVLLAAHNQLMLRYLASVHELFRDDARVSCCCTSVSAQQIDAVSRYGRQRNLPFISPGIAAKKNWDMVLVSDHIPHNAFHPATPVVLAYHAISGAKVLLTGGNKELYRYARAKVIRTDGSPYYACIFETSGRIRDEVVAATPALAPVIAVAGDLQTDELLAMAKRRRQIRAELGCRDEQTVVLLGSSHGTESLMEAMGREIVAAAKGLQAKYRFIVSTHPNHWGPENGIDLSQWMPRLERDNFIVHKQPEPLGRYLVACDLAVTDFGSMAVSLALLRKPMVIIDFPEKIISKQSTVAQLAAISPRLADPSRLDEALMEALHHYPMERLGELAATVLQHPGEAKKRIGDSLYRLLELDVPVAFPIKSAR